MRVYSIEEPDYTELEEWVEKVVMCGKKILDKMNNTEPSYMGMRSPREDEDYDYKIKMKRGGRYY